ncbi:MAG: hypothetical protein H7Y60_06455 [Rhodospirillaceae bacterium]|nr:hypothetical protein [Rhodospirillales bacterium]
MSALKDSHAETVNQLREDAMAAALDPGEVREPIEPRKMAGEADELDLSKAFRPLGVSFDGGSTSYYLCNSKGGLLSMTMAAMKNGRLLELAPLEAWVRAFPSKKTVKGERVDDFDADPRWTAAADWVATQCSKAGMFLPKLGSGWGGLIDGGTITFNTGEAVICGDGTVTRVNDYVSPTGRWAIEPRPAFLAMDTMPLSDEHLAAITDLMVNWPFTKRSMGHLVLGYCLLAGVSGILNFKPQLWLTGGSGGGKSWLISKIITPLLGGIEANVAGTTTEPGIRQTVKGDARPVVMDEAAAKEDDQKNRARLDAIIAYARNCASESDAAILKGGAHAQVSSYIPRSMCCLSSVHPQFGDEQDANRFAIAQLELPLSPAEQDRQKQTFADHLEPAARKLIAEGNTGRRLQTMVIQQIQRVYDTVEVFRSAFKTRPGTSPRYSDCFGTLLAGAWLFPRLNRVDVPSMEEVNAYIDGVGEIYVHELAERGSNARAALSMMANHRIRTHSHGDASVAQIVESVVAATRHLAHQHQQLGLQGNLPVYKPFSDLATGIITRFISLRSAAGMNFDDPAYHVWEGLHALVEVGCRVDWYQFGDRVLPALLIRCDLKHDGIKAMFKGLEAGAWVGELKRVPGVVHHAKRERKIAGDKSPFMAIPVHVLLGDDEPDETDVWWEACDQLYAVDLEVELADDTGRQRMIERLQAAEGMIRAKVAAEQEIAVSPLQSRIALINGMMDTANENTLQAAE